MLLQLLFALKFQETFNSHDRRRNSRFGILCLTCIYFSMWVITVAVVSPIVLLTLIITIVVCCTVKLTLLHASRSKRAPPVIHTWQVNPNRHTPTGELTNILLIWAYKKEFENLTVRTEINVPRSNKIEDKSPLSEDQFIKPR